jgi:hypothetical protein
VLPLGSIPNVHGIMSIWHDMYEAAAGERERILCLPVSTDKSSPQSGRGADSLFAAASTLLARTINIDIECCTPQSLYK